MTREEASIITELCEQMAAMVAREEQREKDRATERAIRKTLRAADEKRWDQLDFRLDRVQANVEDVRHDLVKVLEQRATDCVDLQSQTDEVVARMKSEAEEVAAKLRVDTAGIASLLKAREDKQTVHRFLGSTTRTVVMVVIIVLLTGLAYALFEHRDDISGDLATGLASTVAVSMLVWNFLRK